MKVFSVLVVLVCGVGRDVPVAATWGSVLLLPIYVAPHGLQKMAGLRSWAGTLNQNIFQQDCLLLHQLQHLFLHVSVFLSAALCQLSVSISARRTSLHSSVFLSLFWDADTRSRNISSCVFLFLTCRLARHCGVDNAPARGWEGTACHV